MITVIWIDWYAYHRARMQALMQHPALAGRVTGIELVGGVGVHQGLRFRDESRADLPVVTLAPNSGWKEAGQLRLARLLWSKLSELNPGVVLVPGYYTLPGLSAAIWGKLHRRCTVLMSESTEFDHPRSFGKEALKSRLIRSLFDWAIAGGKPHVRYLERLGFPAERIARFYDVVDNQFFRDNARDFREGQERQSFNLPENYFLFVGRLAAEKNVDGLIQAFARYRRGGGDWSLVLAGDGPMTAELKQLAVREDVAGAVQFRGLQTALTLRPFYAFAGCFVLPSTREPWGLVVNEAMASGLPVIASTRCGCVEDLLIEGSNGFLFDPAVKNSLFERLSLMSDLSRQARAKMGRESLLRIERYSPGHWADEVARIQNSWLSKSSRRRTELNTISDPRVFGQ